MSLSIRFLRKKALSFSPYSALICKQNGLNSNRLKLVYSVQGRPR